MSKTLYIMRHGETLFNVQGKTQGWCDSPLTERGIEQARLTGKEFARRGLTFDHAYSSTSERCNDTLELATEAAFGAPMPYERRKGLKELNFGAFEGLSVEEMQNDAHCAFRFFRADPFLYNEEIRKLHAADPENESETLTALCARTESFIRERIDPLVRAEAGAEKAGRTAGPTSSAAPANTNILISGHGAMNRGLMMYFRNTKDLRAFWGRGLQANCGVFLIEASVSASGEVLYHTEEDCRIFYNAEAEHIPGLL